MTTTPHRDHRPAATPATDVVTTRRSWWEGVQWDVSALLTEAAHPLATERRAS
ncbi:hypothetical protein ACXR2U_10205 [Jatrophihabitans sp. YIM 134969]